MKGPKRNSWRRIFRIKYILIFFYCCAGYLLKAQSPDIVYLHFTRHNYLATNQVNCVVHDKKKFHWFATSNGIQLYDGNRWSWLGHQKNDGASLPDNNVKFLLEDSRNRFWVLTNSGICLLNRNTFEFRPVKIEWSPENKVYNISSIRQLNDGRIWLTLNNGGLYYFDEAVNQFVSNGKIIPKTDHLIYQVIYDSSHQQYYLGTNSGIFIYDTGTKSFYNSDYNPVNNALLKISSAKKRNVTLYLNDSGQIWFSSALIHSCYDTKKNIVSFCDSTSKIWGILGYTTDRSGITWGYGSTITKMDMATGKIALISQTPDQPYGINFKHGYYMMEDDEHTYWISTNNGVYIYNRFTQQFFKHAIRSYATGEVLKDIGIRGFIEMADSSFIAVTDDAEGLYFFDKKMKQVAPKFNLKKYSKDNLTTTRCGFRDSDNHLWIAGSSSTLLKIYPESGRIEKITDAAFGGLDIYSMTEDGAGNLWFGTFNHLIIRKDAITGMFSRVVSKPAGNKGIDIIFSLFSNDNKYVWAGTSESGLLKINIETGAVNKQYLNEPGNPVSIPVTRIGSIIKGTFNELMMSTPRGMLIMDIEKESFRLMNTEDGLPDNNMITLIKGKKQCIWFASDNGISKLSLKGMKVTSYGILEGLTNETYDQGAALTLMDGQILFGHNEGFTSFHPNKFMNEDVPENVNITGIKVFNNYLNADSILNNKDGLILNYLQNFLTVEFSNMSFLKRYHTEFYYQLDGIDKDWIKVDGLPQATYTSLPDGRYIFKVKCKTRGGISSEKITSFKIRIIPPIWKRWWFYVLFVSLIASVIYLFVRSKYRRKIEAELVRSRIARDLHDDMGSTLSTINILSAMAKKKIDKDVPGAKTLINQISENSNRIMESMDDIVWNINPANSDIENMLSRMREFAGYLLEARGISYVFKEDENVMQLDLELGKRHDFFMIFKEAINNLAKYSECTLTTIEISLRKNTLYMLVKDNGKGFTADLSNGGNGLINMNKRAEALKGELIITTAPGKGTSVELKMPV